MFMKFVNELGFGSVSFRFPRTLNQITSFPCTTLHTAYDRWVHECVWDRDKSSTIHHLMWQSDRGAVDKWALFVSSLQKISEQLSFPLHKDGPSPHEAEAILLQDVVAVLHYLRETHRVQRYVSLLCAVGETKGTQFKAAHSKAPLVMFGHRQPIWMHRHLSPESRHHIRTIFLHLHPDLLQLLYPELLQPAQVCGLPGTLQPDHPALLPSRPYHDSLSLCHQSQSRVPPAAGH